MNWAGVQDQAFKVFIFAKIQGAIWSGYGAINFRYYYNPVADDRRLVLDRQHNLLQPPPGTVGVELTRYDPYER